MSSDVLQTIPRRRHSSQPPVPEVSFTSSRQLLERYSQRKRAAQSPRLFATAVSCSCSLSPTRVPPAPRPPPLRPQLPEQHVTSSYYLSTVQLPECYLLLPLCPVCPSCQRLSRVRFGQGGGGSSFFSSERDPGWDETMVSARFLHLQFHRSRRVRSQGQPVSQLLLGHKNFMSDYMILGGVGSWEDGISPPLLTQVCSPSTFTAYTLIAKEQRILSSLPLVKTTVVLSKMRH